MFKVQSLSGFCFYWQKYISVEDIQKMLDCSKSSFTRKYDMLTEDLLRGLQYNRIVQHRVMEIMSNV